jgi:putative CocE/NonD family hydrolase
MLIRNGLAWILLSSASAVGAAASPATDDAIDFQWGVKIPLRDGVRLNATLYRPQGQKEALPCILTLTPYVAQRYHDLGTYFAAHGYVFAAVDARGRGNSEGEFAPMLQEAKDGPDVVEWLAAQSYCNGKITMWGGSYGGYDQWATAKEKPPHLATIVPVASPKPGTEFPPNNGGVNWVYDMMWVTLTSGRAAQDDFFSDMSLWTAKAEEWFKGHRPFRELDAIVGNPSPIFQTWVAHPLHDPYWDQYVPTARQYAGIDLPILTITGQYDGDQPGALSFYREHLANATAAARAKHYLVIGPWDHFGTRKPTAEYAGLQFGAASLIDMKKLHKDWYDWTLKGAAKPEFLRDKVAYYVLGDGAEEWRYAATLEAITAEARPMYLTSDGSANDVFASGRLAAGKTGGGSRSDSYVYDPLDMQFAAWDGIMDFNDGMTNQSGLSGASGKILVYHTAPFAQDAELAGFPKLDAWIAIDRPDTDFGVFLYEIRPDGKSVLLGMDALRARYRKSRREPNLVKPGAIERYEFAGLPFIARRIGKGSRLRLAIGPMNSKWFEKNYNAGGVVAEESGKDARKVTVTLYHDDAHPSALYLPIARVQANTVAH